MLRVQSTLFCFVVLSGLGVCDASCFPQADSQVLSSLTSSVNALLAEHSSSAIDLTNATHKTLRAMQFELRDTERSGGIGMHFMSLPSRGGNQMALQIADLIAAACYPDGRGVLRMDGSQLRDISTVVESIMDRLHACAGLVVILTAAELASSAQLDAITGLLGAADRLWLLMISEIPFDEHGKRSAQKSAQAAVRLLWPDAPRMLSRLKHTVVLPALPPPQQHCYDPLESQEVQSNPVVSLDNLHTRFIGQQLALHTVTEAMRTHLWPMRLSTNPLVLLFLGPPGTGKTELARLLAAAMHGCSKSDLSQNPRKLVEFPMGQFQEEHSVATLFGSPQGYQGDRGQLSGALMDRSNALVLLDEIEKAHPTALPKALLAPFDQEGQIQDTKTEARIPTKDAVFIMTSNLGEELVLQAQQEIARASTTAQRMAIQHRVYSQVQALLEQPLLPDGSANIFGTKAFRDRLYHHPQHLWPFVLFFPYQVEEVVQVATLSLQQRASSYWLKSRIRLCWDEALLAHFADIYHQQAVSAQGAGLRKMKQVMNHQLDTAVRMTCQMSPGSVVTLRVDSNNQVLCSSNSTTSEHAQPRAESIQPASSQKESSSPSTASNSGTAARKPATISDSKPESKLAPQQQPIRVPDRQGNAVTNAAAQAAHAMLGLVAIAIPAVLVFKCAALVLPMLAIKLLVMLLVAAAAGLSWLWPQTLWLAYQAISTIGGVVIGLVGHRWSVMIVLAAAYFLESEYRRHTAAAAMRASREDADALRSRVESLQLQMTPASDSDALAQLKRRATEESDSLKQEISELNMLIVHMLNEKQIKDSAELEPSYESVSMATSPSNHQEESLDDIDKALAAALVREKQPNLMEDSNSDSDSEIAYMATLNDDNQFCPVVSPTGPRTDMEHPESQPETGLRHRCGKGADGA